MITARNLVAEAQDLMADFAVGGDDVSPAARRQRRWRQLNPERNRIRNQVAQRRYQAKRRGLPATLTFFEWQDICARFGWLCVACGKAGDLAVGHVVPQSRGGGLTVDNVQPLCQPCNRAQGLRVIDYRGERVA